MKRWSSCIRFSSYLSYILFLSITYERFVELHRFIAFISQELDPEFLIGFHDSVIFRGAGALWGERRNKNFIGYIYMSSCVSAARSSKTGINSTCDLPTLPWTEFDCAIAPQVNNSWAYQCLYFLAKLYQKARYCCQSRVNRAHRK